MQTYTPGQRFDFKIGQQVICNGFPGVVRTVYADKLAGMVVVRLASGCLTITLPTESFDLSA